MIRAKRKLWFGFIRMWCKIRKLWSFIRFNMILTRFNKIAISNNKFQMASGQGSHWLIESPTIFSSICSPPLSNICQFYFSNIFALLVLTQSFGSLFHSLNTLCEKECFLMSNIHGSLTNAAFVLLFYCLL